MADSYISISAPTKGLYKDKGSKFLAFAHPIESAEEAMAKVAEYKKTYHDARHVCWAYKIDEEQWRVCDDGEPSGTAGRPILGQIQSKGVSHILVVVVRYFGGILLGTGGLIVAYRQATADALDKAEIVEKNVMVSKTVVFPFAKMNEVMRTLKDCEAKIIRQEFNEECKIDFEIKQKYANRI